MENVGGLINNDGNKSDVEESFTYTNQYFDYHRNMTIFFLICIAVTILGISIDFEKLVYVSGNKDLIGVLAPAVTWISGIYCGGMFWAEWRECALPHNRKMKNLNTLLKNRVVELDGIYRNFSESLPTMAEDFRDIISKINANDYRLSINREKIFGCRQMVSHFSDQLGVEILQETIRRKAEQSHGGVPFRDRVASDLRARDDIFLPGGGEEVAHIIDAYVANEVWSLSGIYINHIESDRQKFRELKKEVEIRLSRLELEFRDGFENAKKLSEKSDILATSLNVREKALDQFHRDIERISSMRWKAEAQVTIKTVVGGIVLPLFLLFVSTIGVIYFYTSYFLR